MPLHCNIHIFASILFCFQEDIAFHLPFLLDDFLGDTNLLHILRQHQTPLILYICTVSGTHVFPVSLRTAKLLTWIFLSLKSLASSLSD